MAHIEDRWKRGNNRNRLRWRARYTGPDGKEHAKSFVRKPDAQRWLDQQEAAKVTRTWTDPTLGRLRLRTWYEEWWPTVKHLRRSSAVRDQYYYRAYVLPRFGDVRLATITQRQVRVWIAELADSGLEPATVHKAYQVLSKLLRAAVDAELISQSPCRRVSLPKIEPEEMRFLDPAEVTRLAGVIDQRYRTLVLVGAYGGLRPGELAGLRHGRVDLDHGTVTVSEIVAEVEGKLEFGLPKTRASRRSVGLPAVVVEELAKHLANSQQDPDAWVFPAQGLGLISSE